MGPDSLGFENQGLLPSVRGPLELGTPGQICVWKDGSGRCERRVRREKNVECLVAETVSMPE